MMERHVYLSGYGLKHACTQCSPTSSDFLPVSERMIIGDNLGIRYDSVPESATAITAEEVVF